MTAPATRPESPLAALRAQRILEKREKRAFIAAINGSSWGNTLSARQVEAFAEFMRRFHLDIGEIDNLGGRPYRNGRYYMRKIAELVKAGRVEDHSGEHIGPDARLARYEEEGHEWAAIENLRRLKERIRLGVPENATHAYVVRVKVKELASATEGVKWYDPTSGKADPIAKQFPVETVESRAWRRVGRLVAAEIPELYADEEVMDIAAADIQVLGAQEAEELERSGAAPAPAVRPLAGTGEDPYGATEQPKSIGAGPAQEVHAPAAETVPARKTDDYTDDYEVEE